MTEDLEVPSFALDAVIWKGPGSQKGKVIADHIPATPGTRYKVQSLHTGQKIGWFTPTDLAILGYTVFKSPPKTPQETPEDASCEKRIPLRASTKIVGDNPLKRGARPKISKRGVVLNVKAQCPRCKKMVSVQLYKKTDTFVLRKHKSGGVYW